MDRTIGKSENRNNDGERLMISLLEIAKSINEVDDDKIIKYKDKDGESQEMTAGAAKKMDKEHPAKQAWDKMNSQEKGDDGSEKDDDDKLGGSDFDRDGGVQIKKDRDDRDDWYAHMAKIMQQQPTDKPKSDDPLKDFEKHLDAASDYEDWYDENYGDLNLDDSEKEELEDLLQNWKYTEDDIQQAMAMGNDDDEDRLRDEIEDIRDKIKDLTSKAVSGDETDDDMDSDGGEEKSSESENEDIIGGLEDLVTSSKQKFRYFDVEAEDSEIDSGRYAVVRGNVKDDPDQHMSVTAVQDGADISYSINIGIGGTPIYFDSKEEAMEAAKKLLDDETIRDTMNGDGDPKSTVLADLDQHAKNVLLPDDHPDKPIPAAPSYFRTGKELDNETITINGQKYRAIKEEKKKSNPRVLKEIYDRTFRSLK